MLIPCVHIHDDIDAESDDYFVAEEQQEEEEEHEGVLQVSACAGSITSTVSAIGKETLEASLASACMVPTGKRADRSSAIFHVYVDCVEHKNYVMVVDT